MSNGLVIFTMSINQYDVTVRNKEAGGILRPTSIFGKY